MALILFVEMSEIESESELGIPDESTVRSVSLAEPLHLANFFVVTDIFFSHRRNYYVSFKKILNFANFI